MAADGGGAAGAADGGRAASPVREAAVAANGGGAASQVGEAAVAANSGGAASAVGEAAVAADGGTFHTCLSGIQRPVENLDQTYNSGRPALTVLPMPNSSEAFPCPLEGNGVENAANAEPQSDQEPAQSDEGTATVTEFQGGDSVYAKSQADLGDAETEGEKEEQRSERKPRDITPEQQVLESIWAGRNDADHVGNIGWLFGNWGKRPSNMKMRNHLDTVLKKQPAMVIGLAECQLETERVLKREPDPAAVAADPKPGRKRRFKNRPEFAYLTLRGKEEDSVLIAVRDQAGCALQHLHTERVRHGPTKEKNTESNERGDTYSRSIIAKVTLPHKVGFLGRSHVAMVVHMHNVLANGKWPNKLKAFWNWLWEKIQQFNVQVLMGDFNMSLFRVIPELRSRGATIDLAAWYPWKSLEGEPMSDSCGIFFVDVPGVYTLNKNLDDIHDRDPTGVLYRAEPVTAEDSAVAGQRQREGVSAVAGQSEDSDESDYYSERPKRLPIFDRIGKMRAQACH